MIDCDRAVLLCAARDERDLTSDEEKLLASHLLGCELCRAQAEEEDDDGDTEWLWLARIPLSEFDGDRPRSEQSIEQSLGAMRSAGPLAYEPTVAVADRADDGADVAVDDDVDAGSPVGRVLGDMRGLPIIDPGVYEWGPTIGRGGMGRVVAARDRRLGRRVAIKELLFDHMRPRFENEARITARLQHPSIVHVHEAGRWPTGEPFYAMKLVEGKTLADEIRARAEFSARAELLPHVISVVGAIAYAHEQGVVHRDLKPSNIVVGSFGETVVIDWGLATEAANGTTTDASERVSDAQAGEPYRQDGHTDTLAGAGTLQYMPLEQAQGATPDPNFDVYALGATLYHVIAGQAPYGHGNSADLLASIAAGPPTELATLASDAPADLLAIVAKAMHRNPAERYTDATELADDLARYQSGQLVGAHDYSLWTLLSRFVARHRAAMAMVAMLLVITGTMAAISVREIIGARDLAVARHAAMLEERGRQELLDGRDMRALPFLQAAYEHGPTDSRRVLLGQAMSSVDAHVSTLPSFLPVDAVALSPMGDRLVTADSDGMVTIAPANETGPWDDGAVHFGFGSLPGHTAALTEIAWSADGQFVATSGIDNVVNVWNPATQELRYRLLDHGQAVRGVAFSADSATLVTWGDDGTVRRWQADTGAPLSVLTIPDDRRIVAVDVGGLRVLTVAPERAVEVEVWTSQNSADKPAYALDISGLKLATFSPDGRLLAVHTATDTSVWAVDEAADSPARLLGLPDDRTPLTAMRFSPDSATLLTGDETGRVARWHARRGVGLEVWDGHVEPVTSLAFASGAPFAVSGSGDGSTRVWHLDRGDAPFIVPASAPVTGESLSGARAVMTVDESATIRRVDTRTGEILAEFAGHRCEDDWCEKTRALSSVVVSRSGELMVSAGPDETTRVWNVASGQLLHSRAQFVLSAIFSPAGEQVASVHDREVAVWSARTGADVATLTGHQDRVTSAHFSPDGSRLVTTSRDGTIRLWDPMTGRELQVLRGHSGSVEHAAVSVDGLVATAGLDHTVRLWNIDTGESVHALQGHMGRIEQLRFDDRGALIASVGEDGSARIWTTADGRPVGTFKDGHAASVALAFAPDGQILVTGGSDGIVRVWSVQSGLLLVRLPPRSGEIRSLAFTRDGQSVIATGTDGIALVWPLRWEYRGAQALADAARDHAPFALRDDRLHATRHIATGPERALTQLPRPDRRISLHLDDVGAMRSEPALTVSPEAPGGADYARAWQLFDQRVWSDAHAALLAAADAWAGAGVPVELLTELGVFAARARIEADVAVAAIVKLAAGPDENRDENRDGRLGEAAARGLLALVDGYHRAGMAAAAWSVTDYMVKQAPGSVLAEVYRRRSQLADAEMDAERAVTELIAGHGAAVADGQDALAADLLDHLGALARQYHRAYAFTFRDRYGRAGLAAYDAYLAHPANPEHPDMPAYAEILRKEVSLEKMIGSQHPMLLQHSMRQRLPQIVECYRRALQTWPELSGTLSVSLYIDNNGLVADSQLSPLPGDSGLAAVSRCVKDSVTSWQVPRPQHSPTVLVDYQVYLTPEPGDLPPE